MVTSGSFGIYLYGIIPTGEQITFDVAGADADHDEVYSIPLDSHSTTLQQAQGDSSGQAIAAVVSASPLPDYRNLKRNDAARYLVAHQRVVETVMQDFPILPAKFGTVLANEPQVRRLLAQGQRPFREALEKFTDLVQMEVVVLWDLQKVFQEIGQETTIADLKAQIANRPVEETLSERITIGQLVQAALEQRRASLLKRLVPPLREVALDSVINPLMDDSMIANVALLVDKAGREALDRRLAALDQEFEGRFRFRCVGPLSPYSFASVEVQALSFEVVDQARRCLGLEETTTTTDIKQTYRRCASQLHPDHNPNTPDTEARMTELTQAYQLLTAYAESQTLLQAGEHGGGAVEVHRSQRSKDHSSPLAPRPPCMFTRQAVEQTLLIAIQRQEVMV